MIQCLFHRHQHAKLFFYSLFLPSSHSNQSIKSNNISQVNHCHNTHRTDVISSIGKSSIISGLIIHIVPTHNVIDEWKISTEKGNKVQNNIAMESIRWIEINIPIEMETGPKLHAESNMCWISVQNLNESIYFFCKKETWHSYLK